MEKQRGAEWKATGTGSVSEPEVTYARRSMRSRTRKGVSQPDGVNQPKEEAEVAWKRQMDEARKDFSRRMEAFMRENSTMERLMERIAVSEQQIQRGEVMTAEEADEAVRRALPWLR